MAVDYAKQWDKVLQLIHAELNDEDLFNKWFRPVVFESFDPERVLLTLQIPSRTYSQYIEQNHLPLYGKAVVGCFGKKVRLQYRVQIDAQNNQSVVEEQEPEMVPARKNAKQSDLDAQLDPTLNFKNYIEGESNKLCRSVGMSIAEHPKTTKFNPMFVFGSSGVGKTHLINAIGVRAKEIYPSLRVLYVTARVFQQQYTTAVTQNAVNDFIAFYQTLDVLIVDDIQEWTSSPKTQETFFHIFDYLFRRQKRIILASDRAPVELKGMHERLITRFACGVTCEVERPNVKLCVDILKSKISRDGLSIPDDVITYIAQTANGSVRELQGIINSLMVFSIVDNSEIDMKLAERIVKRVVHISTEPITMDHIIDTVCEHLNVSAQDVNGKSRKKEYTLARQIIMYLAQKLTNNPAVRIGRLLGGRDHSTVIHGCRKIEKQISADKELKKLIADLEKEIKKKV